MKISMAIMCGNRLSSLKISLPYMIKTCQKSLPSEIAIVDYNSKDGLEDWLKTVEFPEGVEYKYRKYTGREYFHMAHAKNLAALNSTGDYIICADADFMPAEDFVSVIRKMIEEENYVWMQGPECQSVIVVKREEFIEAGGYDERFEFYGPDDKEMCIRLFRRGGKFGRIPWDLMKAIHTQRKVKFATYRPGVSQEEMGFIGNGVFHSSYKNYTLVANTRAPWGQWD